MNLLLKLKVGRTEAEYREAVFSDCDLYRYLLRIVWDESLPLVQFIGLNPSTADENKDDPTLKRCKSFARSWGFGGLIMTNIFAFRATDPDEMMRQGDAQGPNNIDIILEVAKQCSKHVAAWGAHGDYCQWGYGIACHFRNEGIKLFSFKLTKNGQPYHPLYLPATAQLQEFNPL